MYCPVDGIEYREGITRCPEHDVDLVAEPPDVEDDPPGLWERLDGGAAARVAFAVAVVSALLYAVSGIVLNAWYSLAFTREWRSFLFGQVTQFVQAGAFSVALGALGCLAAGVLLRGYQRLSAAPAPLPAVTERAEGWTARAMPVLFALVAGFAVLWAVTGIATAWDSARLSVSTFGTEPADAGDGYINLAALNNAAYTCGLASLAVMGAETLRRAHARLTRAA